MSNMLPQLIDLKELVALLNVKYWTARDLAITGAIPVVKLPSSRAKDGTVRRILVDRRDVVRLIDSWKETHE